MKSKFEKELFKEAKKVQIPYSFDKIADAIGYDVPEAKRSFWNKPKIIALSSVLSLGVVAAVVIPTVATITTESYSESLVSLSISSASTVKARNDVSSEEENSTSFTFALDENLNLTSSNALDKNSNVIDSNLDDISDFSTYVYALMDSAIHAGYINPNATSEATNKFSLIVSANNSRTKDKVINMVGDSIIKALQSNYIYGQIIDLTSTVSDLDSKEASELGVDINKYVFIDKINTLYGEDLSLSNLASMPYEQLVSFIASYSSFNQKRELLPKPQLEEIQELQEQFSNDIDDVMRSLDMLQGEIYHLQRVLEEKGISKTDSNYGEIMTYDFHDYLREKTKGIDFNFYQKQFIGKIDKDRYNLFKEAYKNSALCPIIEQLRDKIATSKNKIDNCVVKMLEDYKQEENRKFESFINVEGIKDEYLKIYEENVKNTAFKNDRDENWVEQYNNHYRSTSTYWYK